jgi:hypothetical protein
MTSTVDFHEIGRVIQRPRNTNRSHGNETAAISLIETDATGRRAVTMPGTYL